MFQKINVVVQHMRESVVLIFKPRPSKQAMILSHEPQNEKSQPSYLHWLSCENSQDRPLIFSFVFLPNSFHFCSNFSLYNFLSAAILGIHKDKVIFMPLCVSLNWPFNNTWCCQLFIFKSCEEVYDQSVIMCLIDCVLGGDLFQ